MAVTIALLALAVLVAAFVLLKRRSAMPVKSPVPSPPVGRETETAYHAVSIRYAANACAAAKAMEGRRFLSGAAPRLPLPECGAPECNCRFIHHQDRRSGEDRRNPYQAYLGGDSGAYRREQRQGTDRRRSPDDRS